MRTVDSHRHSNDGCGRVGSLAGWRWPVAMILVFAACGSRCSAVLAGVRSGPSLAGADSPRPRAPFRLLYSDDTTHITTCVSPYHKKGQPWRPEMLAAAVDEVAGTGVEVHMIQLAHGQVPWYQSTVYPIREHRAWWKSHFGVDPLAGGAGGIHQYLLRGGDPLRVFLDRCHRAGQKAFVSLRLNDAHHVEHIGTGGNTKGFHAISRFYAEHLDCRIGPDVRDWNQRTLNWARPVVRDYMFSLIREQCRRYPIDGYELDFMRHPSFFRLKETTAAQRAGIMTDFVRRVRAVLDVTAGSGGRRWLCVRVPCHLRAHDALGIDLPAMVAAGVDMVNLSFHYFTAQQADQAAIRKKVPGARVYLEMCHCTRVGPRIGPKGTYDSFSFRRTTPAQYYTAAHLAYARGLDGVSTFNFVYYREHGTGERGPFHEPPFGVLKHLADRDWLARQPQHYILSDVWGPPSIPGRPLPRKMKAGQSASFRFDMAPPAGGWKKGGRFRIQAAENLGPSTWTATLNGAKLAGTPDRREPYANPYSPLLATPGHHRAWTVPAEALSDGVHTVVVTMTAGKTDAKLVFLDFALE